MGGISIHAFRIRVFTTVVHCFFILMIGTAATFASSELDKQQLEEIDKFAEKFCGKYFYEGRSKQITVGGEAEIELAKFIKSFVGVNLSAGMNFEVSEYTGVLQTDLAADKESVRNCKLILWNDLKDSVQLSAPAKCELRVDGFHSVSALKQELHNLSIGNLQESLLSTANLLCEKKQRHILWATLLREANNHRYSRSVDVNINRTNENINIDNWIVAHPVFESTESQASYQPIHPYVGTTVNGIKIEDINLEGKHRGVLLLICAGDDSTSDRDSRLTLELEIAECERK